MDITLNHVADGIVKESEAFDVLKAVFPTFLETGNGDLDEIAVLREPPSLESGIMAAMVDDIAHTRAAIDRQIAELKGIKKGRPFLLALTVMRGKYRLKPLVGRFIQNVFLRHVPQRLVQRQQGSLRRVR